MSNTKDKIFINWVGGKNKLKNKIIPYIPKNIKIYSEPFLGAGNILNTIKPKKAILNDLNIELINLYEVIKYNLDDLLNDFKKHINTKEYYFKIRNLDRSPKEFNLLNKVQRASRFLFINYTCFNSLYRVNKKGHISVGYGYNQIKKEYEDLLKQLHNYLINNTIDFYNLDFEFFINKMITKKDVFIYLDPPYDKFEENNIVAFYDEYTRFGFKRDDQERLKNCCDMLNKRGNKFLLSNIKSSYIVDLYKDYNIYTIDNTFCNNPKKIRKIKEVIITNY